MVVRVIGFLFLIVAAITFLRDAVDFYDTGAISLLSSDQLWYSLGPDSFEATRHWGEANLSFVWDPILTTFLWLPAFVVTGVIGVLLVLASRKQRPRRRRAPPMRGTAA